MGRMMTGSYIKENAGLAMRRLSIIDVAGGHQPIFNEARTKALVFNGEIYNYRELREELEARGHYFIRSPIPRRSPSLR